MQIPKPVATEEKSHIHQWHERESSQLKMLVLEVRTLPNLWKMVGLVLKKLLGLVGCGAQ